MFDRVKVLIVGLDTYTDNENYKPLKIRDYPFPTVAFIPELKGNKSKNSKTDAQRLYSVTSFRRLISFLADKPLKEEDFEGIDVMSITEKLKENGIYLTNIKEIKNKKTIIKYFKEKQSEDIYIILFGQETQKLWYEYIGKKENFKVLEFHHPSPRVYHSNWLKFDNEMIKRNEKKIKEVENHLSVVEIDFFQ